MKLTLVVLVCATVALTQSMLNGPTYPDFDRDCPDFGDYDFEDYREDKMEERFRRPSASRQVPLKCFDDTCTVLSKGINYAQCNRNSCPCKGGSDQSDYRPFKVMSYCKCPRYGEADLPDGYKCGINYKYLWVPTQCRCKKC